MAIKLDPDQIKVLKAQLSEANKNSHFVIIEAFSKEEHSGVRMVTDWDNYLNMRTSNKDNLQFQIIRDILPITDNLVYWAVAQQNLHVATQKGEQNEQAIDDLAYYTNKVMEENKLKVKEE
ncbi:hypothetical protein [Lentilactobacillus kisonensis]|uniref:Uncharacterized protein n=2 Tax=Lentilactobacillus kisonensis TaxID=481722 RepID=H1LL31_9LACO|nr:hypothetical protein [Lentilactobacillus kisonensis]EHO45333.1 hypothetical protein HMPREF9104_03339 [Lentilactobacillus kisonensis F0435]KRL20087.1 hypothetical protein FC98_GL001879 [Lentilactobacillus kisonensis DSM 19906 = JCM 15041]